MSISRQVIKPSSTPDERALGLKLDQFTVAPGAGFPDHPHRGQKQKQATVTYMLRGSFRHEDSAGHRGEIRAGGVQWMCAGKGSKYSFFLSIIYQKFTNELQVIHAEMPVHGPGLPDPQGLQLWIDLPKDEPNYQELDPSQIPSAFPEGPEGPIEIKVISGKSYGVESPVRPQGGCWYFHIIFKRKVSVFQEIPAGWTTFAYTLKGNVMVGGSSSTLQKEEPFHTLVLSSEPDQTGVLLEATEDMTELVLIAGQPLDQTVVQYGPFVMTSREEIQKTLLDYQMGRNGFEKAHVWRSEIGKA
ncbi:hypothetical protein Clacol_006402 [Clathrus columnatus]|uniref:Pirin n=1 Tax=Clathrus columnatus TaxID=1419009 RepID=A0AAV5AGR9_9AGAM|nr:hypothetical protein Clacol_006402 [Clathrus columnatus]